jgi:hypothetical protein
MFSGVRVALAGRSTLNFRHPKHGPQNPFFGTINWNMVWTDNSSWAPGLILFIVGFIQVLQPRLQ